MRTKPRSKPGRGRAAPLLLAALAAGALAGAVPALAPAAERGADERQSPRWLQMRASEVRPEPLRAGEDKPQPFYDGCMLGIEVTDSPPCEYRDPESDRTVVLFGDSHALQHFSALNVAAARNGWRLVVLTKAFCTPASVPIRNEDTEEGEYTECGEWRRRMLRRIRDEEPGAVVALSGYTIYRAYDPRGRLLSGHANARALEIGYAGTLRWLQRAGLATVVIRDTPEAPTYMPRCVRFRMPHVGRCDFPRPRQWDRNFDLRAARRVPGTETIDVGPAICPRGRCRAVIRDMLVYRDFQHVSATYNRTLSRWFEPALRRAFRNG